MEIIKIHNKTIMLVIVYKIYITVKGLKSKLIIVILNKTEGFTCTCFSAIFRMGYSR